MQTPEIPDLQAGDSLAWDAAFYVLWPISSSAAHQRLAGKFPPADIQDVAVQAIADAAREINQVRSFEEFKALTAVIAHRRAIDHIRRANAAQRATGATEPLEGREELPSGAPSPSSQLAAAEVARLLVELMREFDGKVRDLLHGYYVEGKTQAELAKEFRMPMGTVGVTLSRALQALRSKLDANPRLAKEIMEALR